MLFEARTLHQRILRQNMNANRAARTTIMRRSLGCPGPASAASSTSRESDKVVADTLDDLHLQRLDWLKINQHADALDILEGGVDSLWRLRPALFISVADGPALLDIAARLATFSYRCWRMETPLFHADNFNRRAENIFGDRSALALLAIPEEVDVDKTFTGCVELPR
jgi:hypothetical protein